MPGQSGRNRGRGNGRRTAIGVVNGLKSALHGHANKLRHLAPPCVNLRPFNSIVVTHVIPSAGVEYFIKASAIVEYLQNQLGLQAATNTKIVIKLKRIDFYAIPIGPSSDRPACNMIVSSLSPIVGDPVTPGNAIVSYGNLYSSTDVGNLQECAKLSYTFPLHMADIPISTTADFNVCEVASNMTNAELRFHIQWSTVDDAPPYEDGRTPRK